RWLRGSDLRCVGDPCPHPTEPHLAQRIKVSLIFECLRGFKRSCTLAPDNHIDALSLRLCNRRAWMFLPPLGSRTPHVVLLGMVRGEDTVAQACPCFDWEWAPRMNELRQDSEYCINHS